MRDLRDVASNDCIGYSRTGRIAIVPLRTVVNVGIVAVLVIASLTSCTALVPDHAAPRESQMLGVWHHQGDSAVMHIYPSGKVTIVDIPLGALTGDQADPQGHDVAVVGTNLAPYGKKWPRDARGYPAFAIDFTSGDPVPVTGINLIADMSGSTLKLVLPVGEADRGSDYVFTR
jgi:hypothetical protein